MEYELLNEDQKKLINEIDKIQDPKQTEFLKIIFTGSAGTGKTTTIIEAIKRIKAKNLKLMILTPTHQSGIVIQKMLEKNEIKQEVQTIHSYFDITPEITDKGERKFIPRIKDIEINEDIFIIDEASMINKELLDIILNKLKLKHLIFIGDKYQLPPVKEQYSPVFALPYKTITLEKIMRTDKNLETFEKVRNLIKKYETENYKASIEELYEILKVFNLYNEREFNELFMKFIEERFKNNKKVKIGSFTNNFVDYYNLHFRNYDNEIENKKDLFSKDDKLILNNPYNYLLFNSEDYLNEHFFFAAPNILKNGEEIKVKEVKDIEFKLNKIFDIKEVFEKVKSKTPENEFIVINDKLKSFEINLKVTLIETTDKRLFLTTTNEETKRFLDELFKLAKSYTLIQKNKSKRKSFWKTVYSISDKIINVNYAYASTIHKLQGQTLDEVFLDIRDFMHLYDYDYNLFLRLIYVGITRTSNDVFILK